MRVTHRMKSCDFSLDPQDTLARQDDRPFRLPDSLPENQRILFKRNDYCGGGARPSPRVKVAPKSRTSDQDDRYNSPNVGSVNCCNIWIGDKADSECSASCTVDVQSDMGKSTRPNTSKKTRSNSENGRRTGTCAKNISKSKAEKVRYNTPLSDLYCRNRLKCQSLTVEHEMKAQYLLLKEQYGRVCEQEALLRNQMALLQAEIILLQTNAYHKSLAEVRRIDIDPIPIRKAKNKTRKIPSVSTMRKMAVKVDPMVSTGRYFTTKSTKVMLENKMTDIKKDENCTSEKNPNLIDKKLAKPEPNNLKAVQEGFCYETGDVLNRCFYFDFPLAVVTPPYTQVTTEKVTRHRLPKLPQIPTNTGVNGATQLVTQTSHCPDGYQSI